MAGKKIDNDVKEMISAGTMLHWMTEKEAAEYLGNAERTLQNWRQAGGIHTRHGMEDAPRSFKRAGIVRYLRCDLDAWLAAGASTQRTSR